MTGLSMTAPSANVHLRAGASALAVLVLTAVHHAYGAAVYDTPWRMHVMQIAVIIGAVIAATLCLGWVQRWNLLGRIATWIGAVLIFVFPIGVIGLFEGAYNHVAKLIVYYGLGEGTAQVFFPPPTYEMPNDLFFEATGVAHLLLALLTAAVTVQMLREMKQ